MLIGSCTSLQLGASFALPVMGEVGSWLTTAARLLLASAILLILTRPRFSAWTRGQWRRVVVYGISLGGMNSTFYAAIDRIPLAIAVTIEFTGPLVLAACLSKRIRDLAWVLVAAAAVAVLGLSEGPAGGNGGLDPIGVLFALMSACFWALYILAGKAVAAEVRGQGPLAVAMLVGGLLVVPLAVPGVEGLTAQPWLLAPLLGVAVLSSVVPYSLELGALRRLPARLFGVLLSLEPVVAAIFGWLLLGQHLTGVQILAMIAVLTASVVTTASAPQAEPTDDAPAAAGQP